MLSGALPCGARTFLDTVTVSRLPSPLLAGRQYHRAPLFASRESRLEEDKAGGITPCSGNDLNFMEHAAVKCRPSLRFEVQDSADVGHCRRTLRSVLEGLLFPSALLHQIDLVVTEMGTNLVRHVPDGGEILGRIVSLGGRQELELLSIDRGLGGATAEKEKVLHGSSESRPSLSSGLRAIRRLAHEMELYSPPGCGTVVLARFVHTEHDIQPHRRLSGIVRSLDGETSCGDGWGYRWDDDALTLLVVDGVGHGPNAQVAREAALSCLDSKWEGFESFFQSLNQHLRGTRGAALLAVRFEANEVQAAGVGNLSAWLVTPERSRGIISRPGIMGSSPIVPKIKVECYEWSDPARMIIQSDGMSSWSRSDIDVSTFLDHDPAMLASVLYRDCRRGTDDSAVVVVG